MRENKTEQRISWLDAARALGISLVVFGHVERGLQTAGILDSAVWGQVDFFIYTFHMPLFFFLSGMNVMRSREKAGFFSKRVKSIMIPYVVFSLLQGSIQVLMSGQTNGSLGAQDLLMIPFRPISPYWFLYVLIFYVALVSFWKPNFLMLAFAIFLTILSPLATDIGEGFPLFQLMYFLSFYVAGALFRVPILSGWIGLSAVAAWAICGMAALYFGADPRGGYYMPYMLPAAVGGIFAIIWVSQRIAKNSHFLSYVGANVIAIYVMHVMATAGTRIFLMKAGVQEPFVHVLLGVLSGVVLPLVALWLMQRLRIASLLGLPAQKK